MSSKIDFPKKLITPIQKKIVTQDNSKFYLNLLMICILGIGIYILYHRHKTKEQVKYDNQAKLLFLNEYINTSLENLNYMKTQKE